MDTINAVLHSIALWSVIGSVIYAYTAIKKIDIPKGWCKVLTLVCGPLAWCTAVVWLLREDLKNPEAWK